jgi:hypothetical protein
VPRPSGLYRRRRSQQLHHYGCSRQRQDCADPTYIAAQDTATAIQKSQLRVGVINLGLVRSAVSSGVTGPAAPTPSPVNS